ncbi:hypothetical protein PG996_008382 [Apiospora saccharicola]|uniref:Archaemetzincin-2 n=1 Tax=Apiospora saccharicola TaxID=335842 RepID=A0ABR1UXV6_9PEZI
MPQPCQHKTLQLEPSAYAREVGFEWASPAQRLAAATRSGRVPVLPPATTSGNGAKGGPRRKKADDARADKVARDLLESFPGPLVLPTDDLAWDPDYERQSFQAWCDDETRNRPTRARKTLYVAGVPEITDEVGFMREWLRAKPKAGNASSASTFPELKTPDLDDYVAYLRAFYHGFTVKPFPQKLRFVAWEQKNRSKKYTYIGLANEADGTCTRIRARVAPDGVFGQQLNLQDVLDAEISLLPRDAYALVLLVDHDLYEDDEDDFCCGRAYGLNRVCVVSTARYHPILDEEELLGVKGGEKGQENTDTNTLDSLCEQQQHWWPASHCRAFVEAQVAAADVHRGTRIINSSTVSVSKSPMRAAIQAAANRVEQDTSTDTSRSSSRAEHLRTLWLARLVRTVSHELGHNLFLDHCVYYACMMQSTTGMAEDLRQPPYLCPVCLAKLSHKVAVELLQERRQDRQDRQGGESGSDAEEEEDAAARGAYVLKRYEALAQVCDRWKEVGLFAGFQAWLRARIEVIRDEQRQVD